MNKQDLLTMVTDFHKKQLEDQAVFIKGVFAEALENLSVNEQAEVLRRLEIEVPDVTNKIRLENFAN